MLLLAMNHTSGCLWIAIMFMTSEQQHLFMDSDHAEGVVEVSENVRLILFALRKVFEVKDVLQLRA